MPTFSLNDVVKMEVGEDAKTGKSLDGQTSQPSSATSSRRATMRFSAHDVARAFQQVPQNPSHTTVENIHSPPTRKSRSPSRPPSVQPNQALSRSYTPYTAPPNPGYVYATPPYSASPSTSRGNSGAMPPVAGPQVWMSVNPHHHVQYYRNAPPHFAPNVIYPTNPHQNSPSPYSPRPLAGTTLPAPGPPTKPTSGPAPSAMLFRQASGGSVQQLPSPASLPSPIPNFVQPRLHSGFIPPGMSNIATPLAFPPSPALYATIPGIPPQTPSTPTGTLYSSRGSHPPHRPW